MTGNPIDRILVWADSTPQSAAIMSADFTITYVVLADSVRRMAAKLRQLGVRPGNVVAIRGRSQLEAIVMLAVLHEGAVSLHGSEAVLAGYGTQIDYLVGDVVGSTRTRAKVITIDNEFLQSLGGINSRIEPQPLTEASPCRIVFSSGTTGIPKGVEFTVASLLSRTASARTNWMPVDPFMCLLGLDTVSGFQTFMWSVLNGKTYFIPGDGAANARLIASAGVRSIKTSPARLENLVDAIAADGGALKLEQAEVAGSLLTSRLGQRCADVLGCTPVYLYGSTEVGTVTRGQFDPTRPSMVGSVVADAELQVVDDDDANLSGSRREGHVRYRTAHTPDHYWRATAETNSPFRNRWFYPGDRGTINSAGELTLSGRTNDVVNAGGAKFNLAELDLWMADIDLFTDCASFQFQDDSGATAIGIAFASKHPVNPQDLAERVRGMLPNLEVRAFVRVELIPRNSLGKVSRRALSSLITG
jgi:acyl-coenzyme A synthetase/AMP-(fatty) acid ligase